MQRRWRAKELAELIRRYEEEGPTQLAQEMCRTIRSVSSRAARLGFRLDQPSAPAVPNPLGQPESL